jgi:hypothetical protein
MTDEPKACLLKLQVPSCKFKVRRRALNFELATWDLQLIS